MIKCQKEKRKKKILCNPKNNLTRMTKNLKKKRILWNRKRSLIKTTKSLKRGKTRKKL